MVELYETVESRSERNHGKGGDVNTTVTLNYVVIEANKQAWLTMTRTSSAIAESFINFPAASMRLDAKWMHYRIPVHIAKSVMRFQTRSVFEFDRPMRSFNHPGPKPHQRIIHESFRYKEKTRRAVKVGRILQQIRKSQAPSAVWPRALGRKIFHQTRTMRRGFWTRIKTRT